MLQDALMFLTSCFKISSSLPYVQFITIVWMISKLFCDWLFCLKQMVCHITTSDF